MNIVFVLGIKGTQKCLDLHAQGSLRPAAWMILVQENILDSIFIDTKYYCSDEKTHFKLKENL